MKNPYDDEKDLTDYRISRGAAAVVAVLMVGALALPGLWDLAQRTRAGSLTDSPFARLFQPDDLPLVASLKQLESDLDELDYARTLRSRTQQRLTAWFGMGNMKVEPGKNGWLFYQPELIALNGWGPLERPPFSVMKDPSAAQLPMAKDRVLEFATQLKERNLPLLLVPVPVKPMIHPEYLITKADPSEPLYHPRQQALYDQLREAGIDVLDVTDELMAMKAREPVFLKQDTHWTPDAMKVVAQKVGRHIRETYPEVSPPGDTPMVDGEVLDRRSLGDLVGLLGLSKAETLFSPESAELLAIQGLEQDRDAPVALLGDSFVNVFDDSTLGFEDPADESEPPARLHAGFAQQLAVALGRSLDVYAFNGDGATRAREEFAKRPDNEVRAKKLVVWVLASRDLLLSPMAARDANVRWDSVTFNPNQSAPQDPVTEVPGGTIVVEALLREKSPNQDPNGTPYDNALHTAVYEVEKVVSGDFDPESEWQAVQWTFKDKEMQPPSGFAVGSRYRLTLAPWEDQAELQGLNLRDENTMVDEFLAERWYVEKAEPMP